jgi:4-methylaminobutanoate oxidase (formaldehyde-forming)
VGLAVIEHEDGITAEFLRSRSFEIEINDQRVQAVASLAPLYDPKSERVRA